MVVRGSSIQQSLSRFDLELWGGVECTVNRIGDQYRSQLDETGHAVRDCDIDLIADIGFAAVRYPILWDQIAPDRASARDWRWHDNRIGRLNRSGQRIIAGLVHHGSGPRYTDLLNLDFARGLARHAGAVAERYPFVMDWTPVNEPVTTARFSALYGHWYPHCRDERSFWLAVLNQIDATRFSMRAIRQVNPGSRLIQTEDLGRTYATAALKDQAAFNNARRWAGWDLLCGAVLPGHDLWQRLSAFGFEQRLADIADDPCPPDIIGINHYLTSDRFLDHRQTGTEGRTLHSEELAYRDIEAVRVLDPPPQGMAGAIEETWNRYRLPIALTEVHNGCTREEQMRWMVSAWTVAQQAHRTGVDVRAVTSWALFGSSGWDTLLTGPGRYEAGAFQRGNGAPRPTAMVPLLQALGSKTAPTHAVLIGSGWWQRSIRFHHQPIPRAAPLRAHRARNWKAIGAGGRPLLIAGGNGTLGGALAAACRHRNIAYVALGRDALDLLEDASVAVALDRYRPWAVVNAAGWVRVDEAEAHEAACMQLNADGAVRIAAACAERDIQSIHFSSDLVFSGNLRRAYNETDEPSPINAYGRSKAAMERNIAALTGCHLVVRTAAFFSPFDSHNFAVHLCDALGEGRHFNASDTHTVSPTYVPDLCNALLDLAIDGEQGLWHLTNGDACSWVEFGRRIATAVGLDAKLINARSGEALGWDAPRPLYVPLDTVRGCPLPNLTDAITRFAKDWRGRFTSTQTSRRREFSPNSL